MGLFLARLAIGTSGGGGSADYIRKTSRRYAKVREGTRRYPTRLSPFGYLHPEFEVLAGTRWYATIREGVSGDVSWYLKVRDVTE